MVEQIEEWLVFLAERRQASISDAALGIYAADLLSMNVDPEAIRRALEAIGRRRRNEGETAFPDWGTVEAEVLEHAERLRMSRMKLPESVQKAIDEDRASMSRPIKKDEGFHLSEILREKLGRGGPMKKVGQ